MSPVAGHPPSLARDHFTSRRVVANPFNVLKGLDLHPKDHNILIFTDASNIGWGTPLEQDYVKRLVRWRNKAIPKCSRTKGNIPVPETVQGPESESDCVGSHRQINSGSLN